MEMLKNLSGIYSNQEKLLESITKKNIDYWSNCLNIFCKEFGDENILNKNSFLYPSYRLQIKIDEIKTENDIVISRSIFVKKSILSPLWIQFGLFESFEKSKSSTKIIRHKTSLISSNMGIYSNFLIKSKELILGIDQSAEFIHVQDLLFDLPSDFPQLPFSIKKPTAYNYLYDNFDIHNMNLILSFEDKLKLKRME